MLDSASFNVALTEYGVEDQEWVLATEDVGETGHEVLLAGGRKEINIKEVQWVTQEGKEKLIAGIRKEVKNVVADKKALRPCSLEEC